MRGSEPPCIFSREITVKCHKCKATANKCNIMEFIIHFLFCGAYLCSHLTVVILCALSDRVAQSPDLDKLVCFERTQLLLNIILLNFLYSTIKNLQLEYFNGGFMAVSKYFYGEIKMVLKVENM